MHQQTNDNVQLAQSLNLLNELVKVQSIIQQILKICLVH